MNSAFRSVALRFLVITAWSLWMGGFTFYSLVVIPTAHAVLGDHTTVGFITQQVTNWLNVIAVIALAIFTVEAYIARREGGSRHAGVMLLIILALLQVGLIALHPYLDRLLDAHQQEIRQRPRFYALHRIYLWTVTVQWFVALGYLGCLVRAWRAEDSGRSRVSG